MTLDKMTVDKLTVDKMTIDKMTVDKMTVDKMTVDKMTVDKMTVDINIRHIKCRHVDCKHIERRHINCKQNNRHNNCRYSYCIQNDYVAVDEMTKHKDECIKKDYSLNNKMRCVCRSNGCRRSGMLPKKLMEVIYFFLKMNILASRECFSLPEHIIRIVLVQSSVFVSFYLNVK